MTRTRPRSTLPGSGRHGSTEPDNARRAGRRDALWCVAAKLARCTPRRRLRWTTTPGCWDDGAAREGARSAEPRSHSGGVEAKRIGAGCRCENLRVSRRGGRTPAAWMLSFGADMMRTRCLRARLEEVGRGQPASLVERWDLQQPDFGHLGARNVQHGMRGAPRASGLSGRPLGSSDSTRTLHFGAAEQARRCDEEVRAGSGLDGIATWTTRTPCRPPLWEQGNHRECGFGQPPCGDMRRARLESVRPSTSVQGRVSPVPRRRVPSGAECW